ncbi:MAG TPA: hypothetical protein DGG94_08000 [Micromonosporaceae bacterium]|nr:hypothetical protein [Micromonosporaceae bacterium]HCU49728.1 hypothetical protein [Micromonosporaceae bacterium]
MATVLGGEHRSDAREADVLANAARMRPDLPVLQPVDELLTELPPIGRRANGSPSHPRSRPYKSSPPSGEGRRSGAAPAKRQASPTMLPVLDLDPLI